MKFFEEASFEKIPIELKLKIFKYLSAKNLEKVGFISKEFFSLTHDTNLSFLEKIEAKFMRQLNSALQGYTQKKDLSIDLFSTEEVKNKFNSNEQYFSDKDALEILRAFHQELKKIIPNISFTFYRDEADKRIDSFPFPYPIRYRISISEEQATTLLDRVGNYKEIAEQCFLKC